MTIIGTSGAQRLGQWLLSALPAYRNWVSDCYRQFWITETGSLITVGTSATERLGQWLLFEFLAHRSWVSDCYRNFWWVRGWILDYYWHSWHPEAGSVTTIGPSDTQKLGHWLKSTLLELRGWINDSYQYFCCTDARTVTTIGTFGFQSLSYRQRLSYNSIDLLAHYGRASDNLRNFWWTEAVSVTAFGALGTDMLGYWLLLVFWHSNDWCAALIGSSNSQRCEKRNCKTKF